LRRSQKTNTLVLVSDHTKPIYENRWLGGMFHFTGIGTRGDQRLDFHPNQALLESQSKGKEVFLFEVFDRGRYIYIGRVVLKGQPYAQKQPDIDGNPRRVWIFPLMLDEEDSGFRVTHEIILKSHQKKARMARRLTNKALVKRAVLTTCRVGRRRAAWTAFEPNVFVAELALRRANGVCQLCEQTAPFRDKAGRHYLETHHVTWLSAGGEDTIENTVALCPNCHRKMHVLDTKADRNKLKKKAAAKNYQYTLFGDLIFC
jgi:5-methylcytosine-specific restriction protein A